jgi:N-terminal domain of toast_rack, DUF2154
MNARNLPMLVGTLWLSGCVIDTEHTGALQYASNTVEVGAAESVEVNLHMAAGELRVTDGSQKLMRADFTYNLPSGKPNVHYENTGGRGILTVEQPDGGHTRLGNVKYRWDLQLNNKVPMDLKVNFGAGDAHLDLGSLALHSVEVDMGVGKLQMDLHGSPKHDYEVHVHGGVGEATIRLPGDIGIWAEAQGGIGAINVRGLRKEGDHWESESYPRAKIKIKVDVQGGIGSVNLIAD